MRNVESENNTVAEKLTLVEKTREWMELNGVRIFLFDMDDTLRETHALFIEKINLGVEFLSGYLPDVSNDRLFREVTANIVQGHKVVSVNPLPLWKYVADGLSSSYPILKGQRENEFILKMMEIYQTVPRLCPGVIETLDILRAAGAEMGVVTHATEEWTKLKMEDIEKYFELVELSDPSRPKSPEVWQQAIKRFKVKPGEVAVVGDNIKGDIQAASKIGVKHLFWIDTDSGWDVYKIGDKPEGIRIIKNTGELPRKMVREVVMNTINARVNKYSKENVGT